MIPLPKPWKSGRKFGFQTSWDRLSAASSASTEPIRQGFPVSCSHCSLNRTCLPAALGRGQLPLLEDIIKSDRVLEKGQYLFRQQMPFQDCFALRSGVIKTFIVDENGAERITDFYLPGDIIGLDSINIDTHPCTAIALERSSLCPIPFEPLNQLMLRTPALKYYFFDLMGQKIKDNHQVSMMLSHYGADQRMIFLLLSLAARFRRRNLSSNRFRIPVSRGDMAGYLGLSTETVSRVLHRLREEKLIDLKGREVELPDPGQLRRRLQGSRSLRQRS